MLLVVFNRLRLWMDMLSLWLFMLDLKGYPLALTQTEWDYLPHVFLTAEDEWDPTVMDHEFKRMNHGDMMLIPSKGTHL
jgi:hypothetical protein